VRTCQDLPGQHLFQWLDGEGETHPVSSTDVNDYIHDAMGEAFTAKHFRTWGASVLAFEALATAKRDISLKTMLEPVTTALGNTPAIARQSYVHPRLIELAKNGQAAFREALSLPRKTKYLSRMERGLIAFLEAEAASAPLSATVKRNG
jgi:DNA topoisomerase-1